MSRKLIHTALCLMLLAPLSAQEYSLNILSGNGPRIKGIPRGPVTARDSMQVYRILGESVSAAHEQGFLAVSVDSLVFDSLEVSAYVWPGPRFSWGRLSFDSIDRQTLRRAGIRPGRFSSGYTGVRKLAGIREKLVTYYENTGYPFAWIYMDSMEIGDDRISGQLKVRKNGLYLFDSLHIKGDVKIHPAYLERLTGIEPGSPYNEERIRKMSARIRESAFLEEIRPGELEFFRGGADVYAYLRQTRANRVNGIIGILADHGQTGKILVTGDLNLFLVNSFGRGESFYFGWSSPEPLTQNLEVQGVYPYVFSSVAGMGCDFQLLKQDTTFLTLNPAVDLRFYLGGSSYFSIFYDYFSSSVIGSYGHENPVDFPSLADVTSSMYGLGIAFNNLDYPYNPANGWDIQARLGIGSRKIRENAGLPDIAYEGVDPNTTKVRSTASVSFFHVISGRLVLHLASMTGLIRNDRLFENELFRLGGIHSVRGADENSIRASAYGLGTVETRFLFEKNSAVYVFFDGGYYEKSLEDDFTCDFPLGFGTGLQLRTDAGIFMLDYALGRQFGNPVNIGKAKIHVGYVNRF